jgi:hypothetical protein
VHPVHGLRVGCWRTLRVLKRSLTMTGRDAPVSLGRVDAALQLDYATGCGQREVRGVAVTVA